MLTQNSWPAPTMQTEPLPSAPTVPTWKTGSAPAIIAGLIAMTVGLFLPWLTLIAPFVGQVNRSGLDTADGKIFAGAVAILAAILCQELHAPNTATRMVLLIGIGIVGVGLGFEYQDMTTKIAGMDSEYGSITIGSGVYVAGAGALVAFLGVASRFGSNR